MKNEWAKQPEVWIDPEGLAWAEPPNVIQPECVRFVRAALRSDSPVSDPVSPDWDRGWKTGYDTAIREGAAIPEGAIPVEVEARAECDCCMAIHDAKHIEPGSYYLVKRRPEPDKETP